MQFLIQKIRENFYQRNSDITSQDITSQDITIQKMRTVYARADDKKYETTDLTNSIMVPFDDFKNYLPLIKENINEHFKPPKSNELYKIVQIFSDNIENAEKTMLGLQIINQNTEVLYRVHNSVQLSNYYITITNINKN